ncbi:hypothetical protein RvY_08738 [Ramazzottius varieornatus]|uniref:C2 domain-containing protein n=1 Tax=Ramazzottius varieornatus TaxID=947166 RepID=A0A1D1V6Y5_RAMVA|nr:hypothetical protein RvY_08738 [Ramazzottius varieornatus]
MRLERLSRMWLESDEEDDEVKNESEENRSGSSGSLRNADTSATQNLSTALYKGLAMSGTVLRSGLSAARMDLPKTSMDLSPMSTMSTSLKGSLEFSSNLLTNPLRTLGFSAGSSASTPDTPHSHLVGIPPFVVPTRDHCLRHSSPAVRQKLKLKDYGSIDPALYQSLDGDETSSFPEDHLGRIWLRLSFERECEKLVVTLVKGKNLPCRPDKSPCDPFVRVCLLPDERRTLQSKVKRKTVNPRFDEPFVFPVTAKAIQQRTLKLTVFDIDRRKKHNLLGYVILPLSDFNVDSDRNPTIYRDLQSVVSDIPSPSSRGELLISLCYNSDLQRLTVNVVEGKNFRIGETGKAADSLVRVRLMHQSRVLKRKKTQLVKNQIDPQFNESFQFKLLPRLCESVSLDFNAEIANSPNGQKSLGRVLLGGFMFARGKELEHWQEAMQNEKEHIQQWHTLSLFTETS